MSDELTLLEQQFIGFMANRKNKSIDNIRDVYIKTKHRFTFSNNEYRRHSTNFHDLHSLTHSDDTDEEIVESMKFFDLLHTFRFLAYEFTEDNGINKLAKQIAMYVDKPVLLDYGCGLGRLTNKICEIKPDTKVFLLDVNCLSLDFAEYRFKSNGFDVTKIPIDVPNIYPTLPPHNICIATEVMEHVKNPLLAFKNINDSLPSRGILYGNFNNHKKELFHVSCDLEDLRIEIDKYFDNLGKWLYIKK
jgi:2-polyprenyl-3-methyl-5-hydroxy-6-metoxy-1,4-benzoquinol methylase